MALPLDVSDEPARYCIQLYHRTDTQADLGGKDVLEVRCGLGEGVSYPVRTLRPRSHIGLYFNSAGTAYCRSKHDVAGLDFVEGNAHDVPFQDQPFDAVTNIESSVRYPRFSRGPLRMVSGSAINEVVRARKIDSTHRQDRMDRFVPSLVRPLTRALLRARARVA
ncbi:methyltransferase domain-containing protein [Mycolicibacterium sp. XJ2]